MSGLQVFGGEGSLAVATTDLRELAASLRAVERELGPLRAAVGIDYGLQARQLVLSGAELERARAAFGAACADVQRAGTVAGEDVEELAAALVTAADGYARAEREAMALPGTVGVLDLARVVKGLATSDPPDQGGSASGVALVARLVMLHGQGHAGATDVGVEAMMAAAARGMRDAYPEQAGEIALGEPEELAGAPQATSLHGLTQLQERSWQGNGSILVSRVDADSGTTWVVTLPGTQDAEGRVWGLKRIPEAMAGDTRAVSPAVLGALTSVGAGRGDRVVLNGHSQGGRHVLNLASDPALNAAFDVEGVVTAGAPGGGAPTPDGVTVIQLEDTGDEVPGLDGSTLVPTSKDRLLVRGGFGPSAHIEPGVTPGVLGWEHQSVNYQDIAAEADASHDPALTAAIGALAVGGGSSVTYRVPTGSAVVARRSAGVAGGGRSGAAGAAGGSAATGGDGRGDGRSRDRER